MGFHFAMGFQSLYLIFDFFQKYFMKSKKYNTMAIPTHEELLLPVLNEINKGSYKRTEVFKSLKDTIQLTWNLSEGEMLESVSNGNTKVQDRIGWAMTFLTKAEFIEKDPNRKMSYIITELGKQALEDCTKNNIPLNEKYLKNSPNYLSNWNVKSQVEEKVEDVGKNKNDENETEEFDLESTLTAMKESVEGELMEKLRTMEWQAFEDFCGELVVKMGYGVAGQRGKRVRDGGIDGTILAGDELNIKEKIYIQAKRYNIGNNIASKDIQAFLHVITKAKAKGVFITTSLFTPDATDAAKDDEKSGNIALIDYKKLVKLCFKYKHGIAVRQTIDLFEVSL